LGGVVEASGAHRRRERAALKHQVEVDLGAPRQGLGGERELGVRWWGQVEQCVRSVEALLLRLLQAGKEAWVAIEPGGAGRVGQDLEVDGLGEGNPEIVASPSSCLTIRIVGNSEALEPKLAASPAGDW
jgi:hypothetical protein